MILATNPNTDFRNIQQKTVANILNDKKKETQSKDIFGVVTTAFSPIIPINVGSLVNGAVVPVSPDQFVPAMINNAPIEYYGFIDVREYTIALSLSWWENVFARGTTFTPTTFNAEVYFTLGFYSFKYGTPGYNGVKYKTFISDNIATLNYNASNQSFNLLSTAKKYDLHNTIDTRRYISNTNGVEYSDFTVYPNQISKKEYLDIKSGVYEQLLLTIVVRTDNLASNNANWLAVDLFDAFKFTPAFEFIRKGVM